MCKRNYASFHSQNKNCENKAYQYDENKENIDPNLGKKSTLQETRYDLKNSMPLVSSGPEDTLDGIKYEASLSGAFDFEENNY